MPRGPIRTGRKKPAAASSPTICAPALFSSPTASPHRTKGAAMCCGASCAALCATPSFSARESRCCGLSREMGQAYPELLRAEPLIVETYRLEETRFLETLARGLAILDEAVRDLPKGAALPGQVAFKLYDTYGFPLDLTQDALRARSLSVDVAGFNAAMERQRADARGAWAGSGEAATENIWFSIKEQTGANDFLGYEAERAEGVVAAIVKDGRPADRLGAGERGSIILNQTPFYGESGGQVGDTGVMS